MDVAALYNKPSMNSSKVDMAAQVLTKSPYGTGTISNMQTKEDRAIKIAGSNLSIV